ncbi:inhibitor of nuclear factor kappa-B kinase subunit beta [Episyrphus balteatus]|uniref:inhibitor of nuclear factor kappa-B kinase subunit beta n=1 Tax=Episyrphus balteatus TaxID=286459 RepID=UPI002485F9BF|nr:inhibitor of nuclear factor kappa-B kinase subunit beta [Episyrphus balteatus]
MLNYRETETNWKFVKELGSGAFGEVSLWENTETGISVAIKRCSVDLDKLALDERTKLTTRWQQESDWMKDINTENIVRACPELCANLVAEQNKRIKLPVIAMEYCDGGNLRSKLHEIENVNGFSENDVRQVLRALRNAVFHLHDRYKITHRDIKPDNIVIKYNSDGQPIYKLTDMGYARILDKETIIGGSMVGSRNYFAPEIVESAEYKNSVDYWSMGIVAFEIICGVYPFLQDGSMFDVLMSIKHKPPGCIAITKSSDEKLCHHTQLFCENRLSKVFCRSIEPWLQLALEADGRKRGYEALDEVQSTKPMFTFYTKLDDALNVKVLTVFWLNRCKFLSYAVYQNTTMQDFCISMERDTGILRNKFYFVLPAGHSLDHFTPQTQPFQLYEEKFFIENKSMLYLVDFETDGLCNPEDPFISEPIRQTFGLNQKINPRIMKQCLLNALFLQYHELRRVGECANGIHEFLMNLESEIMKQEHGVNCFQEKIIHLNGQAAHFQNMVVSGNLLLQEKQITNYDNEWEMIAQSLKNLNADYSKVHLRLKSILNRTRDFLNKSPLTTYQQDVELHVKQFQNVFEEIRNKTRLISPEEVRSYVSNFLKVRKDFYDNTNKYLRKTVAGKSKPTELIMEIYVEFQTILKIVFENQSLWKDYEIKISEKTKEFLLQFGEKFYMQGKNNQTAIDNVIENMETLDIDSGDLSTSWNGNNDDSVLELPTDNLIKDTKLLQQALNSLWGAQINHQQSSSSGHS